MNEQLTNELTKYIQKTRTNKTNKPNKTKTSN